MINDEKQRVHSTETSNVKKKEILLSTSKKTQRVSITMINWLMLFRKIIAIYSENHMKPINTLYGQNTEQMNC
jgi:hypothetical protein